MTTRTTRRISSLLNLIVILAMMFASPLQMTAQAYTETDQEDYIPGSEVLIYGDNRNFDTAAGEGYIPGETVRVTVIQPVLPDPLTCDAVVSETGYWECKIQLNIDPAYAVGYYEYTTLGLESGTTETHFFTDAKPVSIDFSQCQNGGGEGPCVWGNGAINSSNSLYYEGDASVQRVLLDNLVAGTPTTFYIEYLSTKSSKHAYDYLTTYNYSETYVNQTALCAGFPSACTSWSSTQALIPPDPLFTNPAYPNPIHLPSAQYMTVFNGTALSVAAPTVKDGTPYSGDVTMQVAVTFTPSGSSALLAFGGHIASQLDWGVGMSASAISGASYHIKFEGRDNQLQTSAIPPSGTIVVTKDAVPNDAQDFSFLLDGTSNTVYESFNLDDDSEGTLPNTRSFVVPRGTYSLSELSIPAGWNLTNLVCVDPTGNTTVSLATATINLDSNETVTCTFTDTKGGKIIVVKQTDPDGMAGSFEFDPSWGSNFFLSDGQSNDSGMLPPGTYSVAEVNVPAVWQFTGATCSDGSPITAIDLQAGETVTCTFNNTRLWNKNLTVTKTAEESFGRTYTWDIYKTVDKTTASIPEGGSATFNYTVGVTHDNGTDSGWVVSGEITVTNPNAFDVAGVNISDTIDNGGTCTVTNGTNLTIPAGGSLKRAYSCTFDSAPGSGTNTATATWDAAAYNTPAGSASGTAGYDFAGVMPSISNGSVTITDTLGGSLGTVSYTDPSPKEFAYSYTFSGVAGTCNNYDNTATISENGDFASQTVTVCVGKDLTVEKTAAASLNRLYNWTIDKSVDDTRIEIAEGGTATFNYDVTVTPHGYTDSGWALGGTITITNPNDWEDVTVAVADTLDQGGTCTITETAPYVVPKSGTLTLHYTCASDGTTTQNTATVTWDKAAYFTPGGSASANADVTFTISGETNKTITVIDDKTDPANPVTLGTWTWTDGPHTFKYTLEKQGVAGECSNYTNTAVIKETGQDDAVTVTVCVGKDLTVSKTAVGSFDRTYLWTIDKSVDKTGAKIAAGGKATFHYTVDVAQTGFSDDGWALGGVITITNPNKWQAITLTSLTDSTDIGASCSVAPGPYVVPADGKLDVAYSCTFGSAPASYSGRNTATATWDKATAFTPSGTASGFNDFTLAQSGATNKTIHVTDSYAGDLGTVTATDAAPFASASFSYDRDIEGIGGTCTNYDNTAAITETGQSDKVSVEVCVGLDLTVSKTASGSFAREYLWDITKAADQTRINIAEGGTATFNYTVTAFQTGILDSGWTLSGEITLTNPNDWESITLTSLLDEVDNGGVCSLTTSGPYIVPADSILKVGYTCTYASVPTSYSGTNTATAAWDAAAFFTPTGSASGSEKFTLTQASATHETVNVTDTLGGNLGMVTAKDTEPWASSTFTYSMVFLGEAGTCKDYDNTATIVETKDTASQTVRVCVGKDLTVSKTAVPTFTRTWDWTITKDADASYNLFAGDTVTHGYTVTVTPKFTDSAWKVEGVITIHNPNDWQSVTLTSLTDGTNVGGTCTVAAGPYVVPASGSLDVPYTCTWAVMPSNYSGLNTATAAWNKATAFTPNDSASGGSGFAFDTRTAGNPTEINPVITVDDDNLTGENWSPDRAAGEWTYNKNFTCSTNPADYTNGKYSYSHTNTATINETGQKDTATVTVNCYAPVVSKTAAGTYDERHEWDVEKTVDPTSQDVLAGSTGTYTWTVKVTETVFEENFAAAGEIFVTNPHPTDAMTVALSDQLSDGFAATITGCTDGIWDATAGTVTVEAGKQAVCAYTASLTYDDDANAPTKNTVSAQFNGLTTTAEATVKWVANIIRAEATLDDDQNPLFPLKISESGTWTYEETYTCSTDQSSYTNGKYAFNDTNTAIITSGDERDRDTADTSITCHAPVVSKTTETYWNRDWDWTITKEYDGSYNLFAGDTVTHGYKVTVDPTYTDSFWGVKGTITVTNSHPTEAMTLTSLTDLAGGIIGVVECPSLVVPAGGSLTCTYDTGAQDKPNANPFGAMNTATAVFAGANWAGEKAIEFSATPTTEDEPVITVDDDNLTGENWSVDRALGEWTYNKDFTCSTNPADYTNGKYSYSHTNTATINETGQKDTATVDVACYIPQIELTKTGDELSKIGDGVTYDITLANNTPTDAGLRDLSCTISDPTIGFSKTVVLASGARDENLDLAFVIPSKAADPFVNTASVTCKPVAASAPVVGSPTFSVSDSDSWSTNLFQPKVEIVKTGPASATAGATVTYTFTITNLSSADSPNLILDTISDDKLGDLEALALAAGCGNLPYNGTCTFTQTFTLPVPPEPFLQAFNHTNEVTVLYHPDGFPNDIADSDDHTVIVTPQGQLTDTSFCPLPDNQFRLLYHLAVAPNIYRLQSSNPGQFYYNAFYYGEPGKTFTMTIEIPYPFVTQEGAGNPIQVHDGTYLTGSGCFSPYPALSGFTILTEAMTPTSNAGNQIITPEDYSVKQIGQTTTVTVSGVVPASGMAYVTIHLDYGLKKTSDWKVIGTYTVNPVSGASLPDVINGLGSGPITLPGYQEYTFSRTAPDGTFTTNPASYNELKKFAGFMGFVTDAVTGNPKVNTMVQIKGPTGTILATLYTDEDGYYMFAYKHKAKSATYTIKLPDYGKSQSVTVKANGFAAVDFEVTGAPIAGTLGGRITIPRITGP